MEVVEKEYHTIYCPDCGALAYDDTTYYGTDGKAERHSFVVECTICGVVRAGGGPVEPVEEVTDEQFLPDDNLPF